MLIARISMKGVAELDAMLAKLSRAVATEIGEQMVNAGAQIVKDEWIRVAPYKPGTRLKYWTLKSGEKRTAYYGHARDNITIRKVRPRKETAVVRAVTTGDAYWLHIYELGKFDQPPRPTFRPAVEKVKDDVVAAQVKALRTGISKVIGKAV